MKKEIKALIIDQLVTSFLRNELRYYLPLLSDLRKNLRENNILVAAWMMEEEE